MENKHFKLIGYYIGLFAIIAVILLIVWFIIQPLFFWSEMSEIRIYLRLFLVMFAINTFAVLRLYNSIVQNTRFSFKLREALIKLENLIPGIERLLKASNVSLSGNKASTDSLKTSVKSLEETISVMTNKLDKNNAKENGQNSQNRD